MIKVISEKVGMLAPKAEHLLCCTLSNKTSKDVILSGYNLYYYKVDGTGGLVDIQYGNVDMGRDNQVCLGGYDFSEWTDYFPDCAKPYSTFQLYGLTARPPNAANHEFNVCRKQAVTHKKAVNKQMGHI